MDKELIKEIDKLIAYLIKNRNIHNLVPETEKEKDAIESFEYGKFGFYISIIALIVSLLTLILK